LLPLAKVADQIHSWIHQQEQWAAAAKKPVGEVKTTPPAQ
jgi:hypothetical protein